jgi:uncharacterized protein (TIGR02466 family)
MSGQGPPQGELFDLFPTPVQLVTKLLDRTQIEPLLGLLVKSARQPNSQSGQLTHSAPLSLADHEPLQALAAAIDPHLIAFGELILGERLAWSIKELWLNVLERGGRQGLHNHANSFISGVLYLTDAHASASTVFVKSAGGSDFVFNNTNARAKLGAYNAGKWVGPDVHAGDMLLFPSYVLHEVPTNQGTRRVSLAFNAIPDHLDSWGYTLRLSR